MTRRSPGRVAALGLTALALLAGCEAPPGAEVGAAVGQPAPEYAAVTLDGDSVRLAEMRGQVVLLNVWATWCPPCRKEIPELQALHEELEAEGLRVVGVSIDAEGEQPQVRNFVEDYGVTYQILHDPSERAGAVFRLHGVPVTLLIDRAGTIRWRHLGPVTADDPSLRGALAKALAERPPAS